MTDNESHFEAFDDHTRFKHAILFAYLLGWSTTLMARKNTTRLVHFIDGFAGAGQDQDGNPGSPILAMRAALAVRSLAEQQKIGNSSRMLVSAVEKKPKHFQLLQDSTAQLREQIGNDAVLYLGTLSEHLDAILRRAPTAARLTFLDPYGMKGLSAAMYRDLLFGFKSELFMLVSHMGAARLHAVVTKDSTVYFREYREIVSAPSLFEDLQHAAEQQALEEAKARQEELERNAEYCRPVLESALGADWEQRLASATGEDVPTRFVNVFSKVLIDAGALFVLTVPVYDAAGQPKYMLMHASKSPVAIETMKESISSALNKPELSETMRSQIRQSLTVSVDDAVAHLSKRFAGRTVPWSKAGATEAAISARDHLLHFTPMFQFQTDDVKEVLRARGWYRRDRELRCDVVDFPAQPTEIGTGNSE